MRNIRLLSVWAALALAPGLLTADTFTFDTGAGATDTAGELVAASAGITTGNGTITIDLFNLLTATQVKSVGQNLSDLYFTLSNTTSTGSVSSSTGTFIDVGAGGVVSPTSSPLSGANSIGWLLSNSGGVYHLNGLGALASPADTIIGGTAGSSTPYSGANSSITNFTGPHNPFVQGTGEFVLSITGVNSDTKVSNVSFSFGTTPGDVVRAPEASTLVVLAVDLLGLLSLAAFMRRRKLGKAELGRA